MASDWIKLRSGLRRHPKVIAMSRHLSGTVAFRKWWVENMGFSRHEITENVTGASVTSVTSSHIPRVTVCGLADVWAAMNGVVKADGHTPFLALSDLDDIAEIPGFGKAMAQVGWVIVNDDESISFPNFNEFNTPEKERAQPKTPAERAADYRRRKKEAEEAAAKAEPEPVTIVTSRHAEKRREDKSTFSKDDKSSLPSPPKNDGNDLLKFETEDLTSKPKVETEVVELWNSTGFLPKIQTMTAARKAALGKRLKESFFVENWKTAILAMEHSPFLLGQNDRGWKADFDWFLKPGTVTKIMEGKYSTAKPSTLTNSPEFDENYTVVTD